MTTSPNERGAASVGALLWITEIGTIPMAAPEQYGGRRWDEQLNNVAEWAKREGITLTTDGDLFAAHVSGTGSSGERLGKLLEFVDKYPTKKLFVPGSVFADLSPADRAMYITTLDVHDTELIICDQ